jgi:hypothetical protein
MSGQSIEEFALNNLINELNDLFDIDIKLIRKQREKYNKKFDKLCEHVNLYMQIETFKQKYLNKLNLFKLEKSFLKSLKELYNVHNDNNIDNIFKKYNITLNILL